MPKANVSPKSLADNAEFTYADTFSVFALDEADAVRELKSHGIAVVDREKLVRTGKYLREYLAEGNAKGEPIDGK